MPETHQPLVENTIFCGLLLLHLSVYNVLYLTGKLRGSQQRMAAAQARLVKGLYWEIMQHTPGSTRFVIFLEQQGQFCCTW